MPQLRRAEVNKFLQKLEWLLLRKCTLSVNPPRKQRMSFRQRSITYVKSFLRAFTREKRYPTCFKFRFVSLLPQAPVQPAQPQAYGYPPPPPQPGGRGGAGGFLQGALSTAAGVAGGALLFQGIENLLGHNPGPFSGAYTVRWTSG